MAKLMVVGMRECTGTAPSNLHILHFHLHHYTNTNTNTNTNINTIAHSYNVKSIRNSSKIRCCKTTTSLEKAGEGGKMVVELVGAFNELTHRMTGTGTGTGTGDSSSSSSSSIILFNALKLSLPLLHSLPHPLSNSAFSVAFLLADLHMDAEVISAALLFPAVSSSAISLSQVRSRLASPATAHLLHDSLRLSNSPLLQQNMNTNHDFDIMSTMSCIRNYYLKHFDTRALVLHLALKLDSMRHHLHYLPLYHQQQLSLQALTIHAPLAHALSLPFVSLELEDLAFRCLFPHSYLYLDTWLRSHHDHTERPLIQVFKEQFLNSLQSDHLLSTLVSDISVQGRFKSRYSTMRKILKDGRKPEQVNDVLGLRVVLRLRDQQQQEDVGRRACYRARDIVRSLWKEVPHRTKDYIANPKPNGYRSLHMAVDVSENGRPRPLMEIQIRTQEMDLLAVGGSASHSFYKAGLTDPQEAKRLKAIMVAAAELAALRLQDLPSSTHQGIEIDRRDRVFRLLDKNGDGRISIEELMEVMEELGAPGEDAREMMQLLDSNSDGSLSSEEFDLFQKQVEFMRNLEDKDDQYKMMLNEKLQIAENSGSNEGNGSSFTT